MEEPTTSESSSGWEGSSSEDNGMPSSDNM
jgi:hypothetical protein